MKKQRLSKWAHGGILLAMCVCFAACSTEKNVESSQDLLDVGSDEMQITLVEEGFADDVTTATRAVAQSIPAGTVDLGDGLEAEVSLTEDTPSTTHGAATRTIPISDGHYNIVAYDDATNKLVTGVNKQLSGKFVGGVFHRDPGKRLVLAPGTYKFVCYTDGILLDNTYGTGSMPFWGINKKKEMVGMTRKTVSDGGEPITFLMHHRTNRFRFRFTAYTEQLTNVKASLVINYSTSSPYYYLTIPTGFQGPGASIGGTFQSDECTLSSAPTQASTTYPLANEFLSDYNHISWVDVQGDIHISGSIYGKTVNATFTPQWRSTLPYLWQDNRSFTINIKLRPSPALYLFNDGTCGALAEKGTRTPVGVVAREKTDTQEGMAAGLDIIRKPSNPTYPWEDVTKTGHTDADQVNTVSYAGLHDGQNDMNGYNWTWDANSTTDHVVRAEEQEKYPAFYMAGHYQPSEPLTGSIANNKWYIPAVGEVIELHKRFGTVTIASTEPWRGYIYMSQANIDKMKLAFTTVSSNFQYWSFLWTSTTCNASYANYPVSFYVNGNGSGQTWFPPFQKNGANFYILPFIKF